MCYLFHSFYQEAQHHEKNHHFRHGEYDGSGELDADGAKAVFARAKLIRRETGRAATVFTSPVLRCRQTARVIALAMDGAETEDEELLAENCSDRAHECKNRLIALAERQDGDTIAAVSHEPNVRRMFNVGLRPGTEIMFEADDWRQIFRPPGSKPHFPGSKLFRRIFQKLFQKLFHT